MSSPTATQPAALDLTPFFEAFVDRAGRQLEHERPVVMPLPPRPTPGAVSLGLARAEGAELRLRGSDVATLAGVLLFRDDEEIRARLGSPPDAADVDVLARLLAETVPSLGEVSALPAPRAAGEAWRVAFTVAGFEPSELLFVARGEGTDAAAGGADASAAPAFDVTAGVAPGDIAGAPAAGWATSHPAVRAGPAGARPTVLLVVVDETQGAACRERLGREGWRVLDQHAPPSVLNWALMERVVDVVVLDPRWSRAARLRQNLQSDPATRDLAVLTFRDQGPDELLAEIVSVVRVDPQA